MNVNLKMLTFDNDCHVNLIENEYVKCAVAEKFI